MDEGSRTAPYSLPTGAARDRNGIEPGRPIVGAPRTSQAALAAEQNVLRPSRVALGATGAYVAIAALFAWLTHGAPAPGTHHLVGDAAFDLLGHTGFWVGTGLVFFATVFFLVRHTNRAARRLLRRRDELIELERRAVAGVLASSVAHDANNLLMVIFAELEELAAQRDLPAEVRERVGRLRHAASELTALYQRLRDVTRRASPEPFQSLDLHRLVEAAVALSRYHPSVRSCTVRVSSEASVSLRIEPTLFRQMLVNLVVNAGQAAGPGGLVEIRVRRDADEAVVEVHDSGSGVAPGVAAALFEPFVSTKAEGTGLGLLSVKAFADVHRGRLAVRRSDLGGAWFEVRLPVERPGSTPAAVKPGRGRDGSRSGPEASGTRPWPELRPDPPPAPC